MLSTAVVFICDSDGSRKACRVLLDCESQANFVTKKFVETLGLETRPSSLSYCGVNSTVTSTNHMIGIKLQSRLTCTPRLSNASLLIGLLTKFRFLWGETNLIFRAAFV